MTRESLNASLWVLVRKAQDTVQVARDAVRSSNICPQEYGYAGILNPGNYLDDDAACATLRSNVSNLEGRVLELASHVGTVTLIPDAELTQRHVEDLEVYGNLIIGEAENLVDSANISTLRAYLQDTVRQFVEFLALAVRTVVEVGAEVAGAAVGGLLDGLGPVGTLALVGVLYLAFLRAK